MAEMKKLTINGTPFTLPFAPAGYGLGGMCQAIDSFDNAIDCGFYASTSGLPDIVNGYTHHGIVYHYNGIAYQDVRRSGVGGTYKITRKKEEAYEWTPWEWENPPMVLGVEYRTTKRYNGKVVYTKLANAGQMPNTTYKYLDGVVVDGCTGFVTQSLRLVSPDNPPNDISSHPNLSVKAYYDGTYGWVIFETSSDLSALTCYITLEYTKD